MLLAGRRPFRPSLSSFSRSSASLKPVQELSLLGEDLLADITLVGGNHSGLFISAVQSGSVAEKAGLREGHHLLLVGRSLAGPERMRGGADGRRSGGSMCVK
ncbi:Caspase recruitment domain-containing protein 11 [Liparis tanakae]|uniref:Caspase recruitment domain-containing protein 11 n=1 Tax=Liparis tanakae TaxID=230148 RepID=A0A4Z2G423_9TELE|nr:Caspase recruitment domain-containing protein 11 [Liparis tanakae]